ncbi:MAG: glycosyltransferase family 87 protein [Candidatus Limnocylindrales bacterium]
MPARGRALAILKWAALILVVAYFLWRGVWRGATDSGDLAVGFSAARAWLLGHDPYDAVVLNHDLLLAGATNLAHYGLLESSRNVYFPTTLPVFVPLALASWPEATVLAAAINVGASLFIALGVSNLLGWRLTSSKALALTAFLLAWAPEIDTIASGQTGIAATAAVVAAMLLERSGRRAASGVAYGLATAIKVQVGLPFLAYLLWRRRWAPALASGLLLGGLTVLSIVRMQAAETPWLSGWLANLSWESRPGGVNDPSPQNPLRYVLINLQYPLSSLIANGALVELMTLSAVGVAALAFVWLRRSRDPHPDLLALAIVAVLGLLVSYHRYYDGVLLAIPITWACSAIGTPRWREGVVVLALGADFILPVPSLLHVVQQRQILPPWLTGGVFWNAVVLPQFVWALVLMAIVLLIAAARDRQNMSAARAGGPTSSAGLILRG